MLKKCVNGQDAGTIEGSTVMRISLAILTGLLFVACRPAWSSVSSACEVSVDGKTFSLKGTYQVVSSFPDFTVQVVESFPDLKVKKVSSFPDDCGEWKEVSSFPDFKIQFVSSFPDVKIKYVESFPGLD
jgi:hypothetical protein